ncbi:MAG: NCS2 family permease [Mycoplasma sp.]|nr:NCS2 family permease [Mycoplasma sp.]
MKKISLKGFSISKYFKFSERKATFKKEIVGGIVTFLAMAYILAVQPAMIHTVDVINGTNKLPIGGIFLATVISSFFATMVMGILANVPISLAPGMGINAFFVFTVCLILRMDPYVAMSSVLVSGWLYFFIAITPARKYIANALPKNIKIAIGAGIGFFLAFLGLQQSGIIQSDAQIITGAGVPPTVITATSVKIGNFKNPLVLLAVSLIILTFILHTLKIKGSIIIAMLVGVAILAIMYASGVSVVKQSGAFKIKPFESAFNELGTVAGKGWTHLGQMFSNPKAYIAIFVFLYSDFFDTTGTIFAIDEQVGISKREGTDWIGKANISDSIGTLFGASLGSSTVTSYIESTAGATSGAKTGFAACVTGTLFLLSMFMWPIMGVFMPLNNASMAVHNQASPGAIMPITSPSLVLVGSLMMMQLKEFDWKEAIDVPVVFLTILMMVLTYNISTGIAVSIVIFVILNFFAGLKQRWDIWRGNPVSFVDDSQEMILSDMSKKSKISETKDYWKRINIPIVVMFIIALAFFGTMPLYLY